MANEATIVTLLGNKGDPIEYVVNVGSPITKGTLMYVSGATVAGGPGHMGCKATTNVGSQIFAGIAAEDFASGTAYGRSGGGLHNKLPCWTHGVFNLQTSDVNQVLIGETVCTSSKGPNFIGSFAAGDSEITKSPFVVGKALRTFVTSTTGPVLINVGRVY